MASEPSGDRVVSVALPAELTDWLDRKTAELDVEEEELVVQLLASYRAAEELDGEVDSEVLFDADIEPVIRDVVADRVPDIARAVEEHLDGDRAGGEDLAAVEDRLERELERLEREIADAESSFQSKLEDVRERVIQVKRETDGKAPAEHSHAALDDVPTLRSRLEALESTVDGQRSDVDDVRTDLDDIQTDLDELEDVRLRFSDVEEKLNTVAWVVNDLRESVDSGRRESRALDRLRQTAAEKDIDRAICDNCENPVDIALLAQPNCPHCEMTLSDVRLPGGFFGKPRLSVAKQLEAGDDSDVADARR